MTLDYSNLLKPEKLPRGGSRPGSGRKPRDTKTVIFRLSPDVIHALHLASKTLRCSMSSYVDKTLRKRLKKYLKPNTEKPIVDSV